MAPLGALFGAAAALRVSVYEHGWRDRKRLGAPVISIGNIAVGGRGKTPLVELSARLLRDAGLKVAVLSRGYGGTFRGEYLLVSEGQSAMAKAADAGDEPVMLARALPGVIVAVGHDRARVGHRIEEFLRPDVFVLDDGFQHLRLRRDLDVVCVDAGDLRERPLPAGALRERPSALGRAGLVAVGGEDEAAVEAARAELARRVGAERVLRLRRRPDGFVTLAGVSAPAPVRPYLLTGIARPERVRRDLAAQGLEVAGHSAFVDHHRFTAAEIADVAERAGKAGADAIVTTAKDAVRLPAVRPAGPPFLAFRIACVVEDAEGFRERLLAVARPR